MESKVPYPKMEIDIRSDFVPFMGGAGLAPDPIQYCLFGFAACFAGIFLLTATMMGIKIQSTKVSAENFIDLSKPLRPNNPIVEKVKIALKVKSDLMFLLTP